MAPEKKRVFDVSKLQSMQEPLTLRVERMTGNSRSPIPLPPRGDGAAPGTGWDISSILDAERWVVEEIAGGGTYEMSVTDNKGESMIWTTFWDPKNFIPRIPSTLTATAQPMPQYQAPQQQVAGSVFQPMQVGWPPSAAQMWQPQPVAPPQQMQPMPQFGYQPQAYMQSPVGYQYGYQPPPAPPSTRLGYSYGPQASAVDPMQAENRQLLLELQRQREERAAAEHRAEMERVQQSHAAALAETQRQNQAQLQALQQQIAAANATRQSTEAERLRELDAQRERERVDARFTAILEAIKTTAATAPTEDPRLRTLEETIRSQNEAAARDRERMEREQEKRELRAEMLRAEEKTARLIETMSANRPDPMIALMQENSRNQVESSRQLVQLQQAQMTAMQAQVMPPHQLFTMMRDASSGTDSVLKSAVGVYNDLFSTARNMFEQMTKMVGGEPEHPAIRIAEGVGASMSKLADRYLAGQANKEIQESKAKQEQARAYAQYVAAQQQQASGGIPQPASTAQPAGELNGAPAQAAAPTTSTAATPAAQPTAKTEGPDAKVIQLRRLGRTDREWFGDALPDAEKLRAAVAEFIEGLPLGRKQGVDPEEAAQFIAQGINSALALKVDVKAFTVLFQEGRYAEFMDVLLPDAPQTYRDDCAKVLIEMVNASDEDDEDDVDEDGEDGQDAEPDDEAGAH